MPLAGPADRPLPDDGPSDRLDHLLDRLRGHAPPHLQRMDHSATITLTIAGYQYYHAYGGGVFELFGLLC